MLSFISLVAFVEFSSLLIFFYKKVHHFPELQWNWAEFSCWWQLKLLCGRELSALRETPYIYIYIRMMTQCLQPAESYQPLRMFSLTVQFHWESAFVFSRTQYFGMCIFILFCSVSFHFPDEFNVWELIWNSTVFGLI